jgi:hypothetical protein
MQALSNVELATNLPVMMDKVRKAIAPIVQIKGQ